MWMQQISLYSCLSDLCLNSTPFKIIKSAALLVLLDSQIHPEPKASACVTGVRRAGVHMIHAPVVNTVTFQWFNEFLRPRLTIPTANVHAAEVIVTYAYTVINCLLWDDTFWLISLMIWWMLPHGASVKFVQAESCVRQKDVSENFKFTF